jgi:hypothetical protein
MTILKATLLNHTRLNRLPLRLLALEKTEGRGPNLAGISHYTEYVLSDVAHG